MCACVRVCVLHPSVCCGPPRLTSRDTWQARRRGAAGIPVRHDPSRRLVSSPRLILGTARGVLRVRVSISGFCVQRDFLIHERVSRPRHRFEVSEPWSIRDGWQMAYHGGRDVEGGRGRQANPAHGGGALGGTFLGEPHYPITGIRVIAAQKGFHPSTSPSTEWHRRNLTPASTRVSGMTKPLGGISSDSIHDIRG